MSENVNNKLDLLKKIARILKLISKILSIVAVFLIVFYLLAPATNLFLEGSSSKYGRISGYNYYGWQLAIFGCGYPPVQALALFENKANLAGDYIPTTYDFATNMTLLYAIIIPLLVLIITGIVATKMRNRGKAVCEFVAAAAFIFTAIVLGSSAKLSISTAVNIGTTPFKDTFLIPAVNNGTYTTSFYPIFLCVMLILFALIKAGRGAFLIYQRNFALKAKK